MSRLRVVFVARRFWPLVGGPESSLRHLAAELSANDVQTTVLTARWSPDWPAALNVGGICVVRLPPAPRSTWPTLLYLRAVAAWLRQHRDRYDVTCISGLGGEAAAAVAAVGRHKPVVLRAERAGPGGDCQRQQRSRWALWLRRQSAKAAAIVATSRAVEAELLAAGHPAERVRLLPNGVPLPPPRTAEARRAAREALAEADNLFELPEDAPLVVYTGRLAREKGLDTLLAAWESVTHRWPAARLWLAGEGPARLRIMQRLVACDLADCVRVTGAFDQTGPLLAAADVAVAPAAWPGSGMALREAMAAGLPVLAADNPLHRELAAAERECLLLPPDDPAAWAAALNRVLEQPELAAALGRAARNRAEADFALARTAAAHLTWLHELHAGGTP